MNTVFVSYDSETDDYESYNRMTHRMPAGTNVNTIRHYSQFRYQDRFMYFDYGEEENLEVYGTADAPDIPLDQIGVPVALLTASEDDIAPPSATNWLADNIPSLVEHILYPVGHLSFIVSINNDHIDDLLRIIQENTGE